MKKHRCAGCRGGGVKPQLQERNDDVFMLPKLDTPSRVFLPPLPPYDRCRHSDALFLFSSRSSLYKHPLSRQQHMPQIPSGAVLSRVLPRSISWSSSIPCRRLFCARNNTDGRKWGQRFQKPGFGRLACAVFIFPSPRSIEGASR